MKPSKSERMLNALQKESFGYFLYEYNPDNGLVADSTRTGAPATTVATGFALSAFIVGVERGFMTRTDAVSRTLTTLRFFSMSRQDSEADATGYKGFYYHFLHMKTGLRTWNCELSTIDTALLLMGVLSAAQYYDQDSAREREIREGSEVLVGRGG